MNQKYAKLKFLEYKKAFRAAEMQQGQYFI